MRRNNNEALPPGLIEDNQFCSDIVQDLGRELSSRFLELSGHEELASRVRKAKKTTATGVKDIWGKEFKSSILDSMQFVGKLLMSTYLNDLLSKTLANSSPRVRQEESFMAWALRNGIHGEIHFFFDSLPFTIEVKWILIDSVLQHAGFKLSPVTHCFVK